MASCCSLPTLFPPSEILDFFKTGLLFYFPLNAWSSQDPPLFTHGEGLPIHFLSCPFPSQAHAFLLLYLMKKKKLKKNLSHGSQGSMLPPRHPHCPAHSSSRILGSLYTLNYKQICHPTCLTMSILIVWPNQQLFRLLLSTICLAPLRLLIAISGNRKHPSVNTSQHAAPELVRVLCRWPLLLDCKHEGRTHAHL